MENKYGEDEILTLDYDDGVSITCGRLPAFIRFVAWREMSTVF